MSRRGLKKAGSAAGQSFNRFSEYRPQTGWRVRKVRPSAGGGKRKMGDSVRAGARDPVVRSQEEVLRDGSSPRVCRTETAKSWGRKPNSVSAFRMMNPVFSGRSAG